MKKGNSTTGNEIFYVLDGMGSPVALVRYDAATTGSYAYDPYGTYTDTNSSGGTSAGVNPYRYKLAGLYDRTTGWIKYGERWYNPTIGRFTQQDTVLHLLDPTQGNRYTYAGNDPINNSDPTGQSIFGCFIGGMTTIAGVSGFVGTVAMAAVPDPSLATKVGAYALGVGAAATTSAGIVTMAHEC